MEERLRQNKISSEASRTARASTEEARRHGKSAIRVLISSMESDARSGLGIVVLSSRIRGKLLINNQYATHAETCDSERENEEDARTDLANELIGAEVFPPKRSYFTLLINTGLRNPYKL